MERSNIKKLACFIVGLSLLMIVSILTVEEKSLNQIQKHDTDITEQINKEKKKIGVSINEKAEIKSVKEYMDNPIANRERYYAEKVLASFFYKINKKDYKSAYEMFNKNYCNKFYIPFEIFKTKYSYNKEKVYIVKNVTKMNNKLIANVNIVNKIELQQSKDNISFSQKTISIYPDGTIDDMGIVKIWSINKKEKQKNIEVEIIEEIELIDSTIFRVKIKNNLDKQIVISNDSYGISARNMDTTFKHKLINGNPTLYRINANDQRELLVMFLYGKYLEEIVINYNNSEEITVKL